MPRILIIDDEPFLLEMLERYLGRLAAVDAVGSGQAAAHLVRRHRYDVAVVDLRLGRDDGIDVVEALLRQQPRCIGAVVFHTGVTPMPQPPLGVVVPHVVVSKGDLRGLKQAVQSRLGVR